MPAYLDASAVVKLVVRESGSDALGAVLGGSPSIVSSELVRAELPRAIRRLSGEDETTRERLIDAAIERLAHLDLISVSPERLDAAGALVDPALRTLDAIHIASALVIAGELDAFITYDTRQAAAATRLGLPVRTPR